MKKLIPYLTGVALLVLLAAALLPAQKAPDHRVVVEVTGADAEAWTGALNNIENLRKALAPAEVRIEAVAHGKGLGMLLKSNGGLKERLEKMSAGGVVFAACQNSMRHRNVTKEDLFPFATTVDSGVAEVVRKQEAGYAYLKTGE